jgi:PAB-dependent poly(A)-specific ribonuclease subunit 2
MSMYSPLQLLPLPPDRVDAKPYCTAVAVDPFADVLWTGSSSGTVTAWCGPLTLARNVQFPAHGKEARGLSSRAVKQIRVTDREVWTLTEGGVGGRKRGGAPKWSVTDPSRGLRSMSPNPTNSHEVLAGGTGGLILVNTARGEIARRVSGKKDELMQIDYSSIVHLAPLPRTVVAASASGSVSILDPRTGFRTASNVNPVQAHTGGLSGADAAGHLVCTWGWTHV